MASSVFFSLFCYVAQRTTPDWAGFILAELDKPYSPGFCTLAALREDDSPVVLAMEGSTLIAKARSRMAGVMLAQRYGGIAFDADVWISCDEDVQADASVMRALVAACRRTHGVVSVPCLCRDGRPNIVVPEETVCMDALDPALLPITATGAGLIAVHHDALERVRSRSTWVTDEPVSYPALFLEYVDVVSGSWIGEDVAFSRRMISAGVPMHALCEAKSVHAGKPLILGADGVAYGAPA